MFRPQSLFPFVCLLLQRTHILSCVTTRAGPFFFFFPSTLEKSRERKANYVNTRFSLFSLPSSSFFRVFVARKGISSPISIYMGSIEGASPMAMPKRERESQINPFFSSLAGTQKSCLEWPYTRLKIDLFISEGNAGWTAQQKKDRQLKGRKSRKLCTHTRPLFLRRSSSSPPLKCSRVYFLFNTIQYYMNIDDLETPRQS